jgi:hypothetical protein
MEQTDVVRGLSSKRIRPATTVFRSRGSHDPRLRARCLDSPSRNPAIDRPLSPSENVGIINDHVTRRKQRVAVSNGCSYWCLKERGVYAPVNKGAADLGPFLHHAEVMFAGVLGLPPGIAHPRRLLG